MLDGTLDLELHAFYGIVVLAKVGEQRVLVGKAEDLAYPERGALARLEGRRRHGSE